MKKLLYYLPTIIFNVLEFALVLILGNLFHASIPNMISIVFVFMITRNLAGEGSGKHYKNPILCLIWSVIMFTTLSGISTVSFILSIILTIFYALVQTNRFDVTEAFMWKGKETSYGYLKEFVERMEGTSALSNFENKLAKVNPKAYKVYYYRFKKDCSFHDISEILEVDNRRISEILKSLELCIKIYFDM